MVADDAPSNIEWIKIKDGHHRLLNTGIYTVNYAQK